MHPLFLWLDTTKSLCTLSGWMPFISGYAVNQASTFFPLPGSPLGIWTFEDWFVQVPVPRAKTVFKCQPKGKISNYDFECIDPALKHRLHRPLSNFLPNSCIFLSIRGSNWAAHYPPLSISLGFHEMQGSARHCEVKLNEVFLAKKTTQ